MLVYYIIPALTLIFNINGNIYPIIPSQKPNTRNRIKLNNITREEELKDIAELTRFMKPDKY